VIQKKIDQQYNPNNKHLVSTNETNEPLHTPSKEKYGFN